MLRVRGGKFRTVQGLGGAESCTCTQYGSQAPSFCGGTRKYASRGGQAPPLPYQLNSLSPITHTITWYPIQHYAEKYYYNCQWKFSSPNWKIQGPLSSRPPSVQRKRSTPFQAKNPFVQHRNASVQHIPKFNNKKSSVQQSPQFNLPFSSTHPSINTKKSSIQHQKLFSSTHSSVQYQKIFSSATISHQFNTLLSSAHLSFQHTVCYIPLY